jgi:hypothetical protein
MLKLREARQKRHLIRGIITPFTTDQPPSGSVGQLVDNTRAIPLTSPSSCALPFLISPFLLT